MKKSKKKPALIKIIFFTLITALTWIGFEVYNVISKKPSLSLPDEKILSPLVPELNLELLDSLDTRIYLNQNQIEDNLLLRATPEPEPTEEPVLVDETELPEDTEADLIEEEEIVEEEINE